ncbi:amino acid/amide ABC transporter ATP-binding protein 1, HAAT family [Rhizobium tibeticum]|uniref:Amino acid/amide ABC transporter ATP-binding protein 1, HAAT family n=1 Tax=Rhizobium tibeticum TaxID=501024 RepID=A0A1H8KSU1_9HYPH|nr:ABC transporter ATP-binding protein [Rhizobium tibeticum]SEH83761.1 Lipopolysaccharide export system ATP-binding protein LptB [Rhizobium tibeticum]SEN95972.1 amino acid/amide ABC transporter ATP-binding protein 1, HAAT family [Rhizobium tibeticum]
MHDQVLLKAEGLSKSFGAIRVIHDVGFEVHTNEVLGLLGPNGAGKTTLFNLISGDLKLDAGELLFAGAVLQHEPPYKRCKRGIGRTYQIPKPYGGMTTFENLMVAAMFGASRSERSANDHCAQILEDCGLADKANKTAGSLTLLDRKRLEMARAMASDPKLRLLDEIAGGLTEHESHVLVDLVKKVRRRNVTVVWIEHVLNAIMAAADRMMVLNFGEKIAEGTPQAVIADPNVRRVYMGIEA